ncbi:anti-sigma factor [Kribbella italica]|uniref:Regulator of SigK n=1 Tax=Kribbella italica TaxID=1540520 RepID=A0A7W9MZ52_9ACTN|nr:anti-sigma factor [Kribbella italica]MBB5841559.1 anti-sigma-K factor RskA [Kribbella italica]
MTTTAELHTLTGPYVLDAITDDERDGFERHLALCTACTAEIDSLREAIARLSLEIATEPPTGLKSLVLARIEEIRQQRPVSRAADVPDTRRRMSRRVLLTLAAAFVAVGTSGAIAIDQYRDNAATTTTSARANEILAEPDARTLHGAVTGGQATLVVSRQRDAAVVLVQGLRSLPEGMTYQLWMVDSSRTAHSIGLVEDGATVVTRGVADKVAFGITVEPEGGSATPTLPATGGLRPVVQLD